jgi:hypothetical protein
MVRRGLKADIIRLIPYFAVPLALSALVQVIVAAGGLQGDWILWVYLAIIGVPPFYAVIRDKDERLDARVFGLLAMAGVACGAVLVTSVSTVI